MKERIRQLALAFKQLRQVDDKAVWLLFAAAMVGLLAGVGLGMLIGIWAMPVFGILFAMMATLVTFNLRLQKAQYAAIHGQPGAAAAVLNIMRGQWFVSPAVAVNNKQDMVHRVVGRPGVILVGEGGSTQRIKALLAKERKRLAKVVGDAPIVVLIAGDGDGQVPLKKLQRHLTKLPREVGRKDVPKLERRLKPLDRGMPIPKGIDPMAAANRRRPKPR